MAGKTVRTTAALPGELLKALERSAIDADFAGMTDDADYHAEAQKIAEQFIKSDWESLHAIQEPS